MRGLIYIFFGIAVACGILVLTGISLITRYLNKHGENVDFWSVRWHLITYLKRYRKITIEQNGKTGGLFYLMLASLGGFLVSMILVAVTIVKG